MPRDGNLSSYNQYLRKMIQFLAGGLRRLLSRRFGETSSFEIVCQPIDDRRCVEELRQAAARIIAPRRVERHQPIERPAGSITVALFRRDQGMGDEPELKAVIRDLAGVERGLGRVVAKIFAEKQKKLLERWPHGAVVTRLPQHRHAFIDVAARDQARAVCAHRAHVILVERDGFVCRIECGCELTAREQNNEQHLVGARRFGIQFDTAARCGQAAFEGRRLARTDVEAILVFAQIECREIAEAERKARVARGERFETIAAVGLLRWIERAERFDNIDEAMIARVGERPAEHFGALMGIDDAEGLEQSAGKLANTVSSKDDWSSLAGNRSNTRDQITLSLETSISRNSRRAAPSSEYSIDPANR